MNDLELQVAAAIPMLRQIAKSLEGVLGNPQDDVPYCDFSGRMPVNPRPFQADFLRCFPGRTSWPERSLDVITGLTIHHTLSHSPKATARYCTAVKGYPTVQYHYWVSAGDGCPCFMLADPKLALWHDHTGAHPTTLSIGMAGSLHLQQPPGEQLEAAVRLAVWLARKYSVPIEEVKGHKDRYRGTVCPGWDSEKSGYWRHVFYDALRAELNGGEEAK